MCLMFTFFFLIISFLGSSDALCQGQWALLPEFNWYARPCRFLIWGIELFFFRLLSNILKIAKRELYCCWVARINLFLEKFISDLECKGWYYGKFNVTLFSISGDDWNIFEVSDWMLGLSFTCCLWGCTSGRWRFSGALYFFLVSFNSISANAQQLAHYLRNYESTLFLQSERYLILWCRVLKLRH